MGGYSDILLTWKTPRTRKTKVRLHDASKLIDMMPYYQEEHSEVEKRLNHTTLVITSGIESGKD